MIQNYSKFVELKRVPVIDVPITGTNMSECIEFLTRHIDDLHGEYICVSNAHTSVMAHDDPSYWACQAESVMSVPDGKPFTRLFSAHRAEHIQIAPNGLNVTSTVFG